jgi:nitrite reductase/ring-hydroxylating ferredoxin subunit
MAGASRLNGNALKETKKVAIVRCEIGMTGILTADAWRQREFAPTPGTQICRLEDVPDNAAREFYFGEGRDAFRLLVLRRGANVWGYVNICPHFSLPLNFEPDKFLLFNDRIYCANHTAVFRFDDGYCEDGPCAGASLEKVPLAVSERVVSIALN